LNPCEISISTSNSKAKKIPPKFDKILGCYRSIDEGLGPWGMSSLEEDHSRLEKKFNEIHQLLNGDRVIKIGFSCMS
jgi:hypothetical protein